MACWLRNRNFITEGFSGERHLARGCGSRAVERHQRGRSEKAEDTAPRPHLRTHPDTSRKMPRPFPSQSWHSTLTTRATLEGLERQLWCAPFLQGTIEAWQSPDHIDSTSIKETTEGSGSGEHVPLPVSSPPSCSGSRFPKDPLLGYTERFVASLCQPCPGKLPFSCQSISWIVSTIWQHSGAQLSVLSRNK